MTYPTIMPALTLDFQNSQQLDPRVTFSRSSGATYINSAGQVVSAAEHEPRFDHDPETGECLGLLIEESRTNNCEDSENFSTGDWSTYQGNVPVGTNTTAPDGTNTASAFMEDVVAGGGTDVHRLQYFYTTLTTCSTSIFVKPNGRENVVLQYLGGANQYVSVVFNLTGNGVKGEVKAVGTFAHIDSGIKPYHNGWYRIFLSAERTTGPNFHYPLLLGTCTSSTPTLDNALGQEYFAGDPTKGVWVWGAQFEYEKSFPTSYIPTSGSTVNRSEDIAQVTTADIYGDEFTIINKPFGVSSGSSTLYLQGYPYIQRAVVYDGYLSQEQINTVTKEEDDNFWRWTVLGSSLALPNFTTDGQVTVDWGDGTIEVLTTAEHTFTNGSGYHKVGFRLDSGTYFRPTINNNSNHDQKLISTGPVPTSMKVNCHRGFYGCTNLESIDPSLNLTGGNPDGITWGCTNLKNFPLSDFSTATSMGVHLGGGRRGGWFGCSSITSFPAIDFPLITDLWKGWAGCTSMKTFSATWGSAVTNMQETFNNCSSLESMPFRQTQNVTNFNSTWIDCSSLSSFPLLDTSSGTNFLNTWRDCTSLTSFPLIDTSSGVDFRNTFYGCTGLTSFPQLDMSNGQSFYTSGGGGTGGCWYNCNSLVSFPSISFDSATTMRGAWRNCSSLQNFPPNLFDNWTGTPADYCFTQSWRGCTSLTATSVENILNSIDTSGQSAPASGVDIEIYYNTGTGTPNITTAVTNLKSRGWTITLNNVAQ